MYLALISASGAPGVSTTALALALNSPSKNTLLVEADPIGSSPVLAGYLLGGRYHDKSLINLVDANPPGHLKSVMYSEVTTLPDTKLSVLPGILNTPQPNTNA